MKMEKQITTVLSFLMLLVNQILCQPETAGQPRGQHCRGFNPEDVPYPTPYIGSQDRADRCKQLFPKFNSLGNISITYIGKNTYHNPCKIDCPLCNSEFPVGTENVIRQYPVHVAYRDEIHYECENSENMEIFEQYMEDGVQCGPTHVCDNLCCVSHPELFPTKKRRTTTTQSPQNIDPSWTQPLKCDEEGWFRNPNDCHKFYRCYQSGGKAFVKTLFSCNPPELVFDDQFAVCVSPDDTGNCEDTQAGN